MKNKEVSEKRLSPHTEDTREADRWFEEVLDLPAGRQGETFDRSAHMPHISINTQPFMTRKVTNKIKSNRNSKTSESHVAASTPDFLTFSEIIKEGLEQEGLQCNAVQKGNPGIITTAGTIKTIIEDPLLSILELDPNKT